jgi:peptide/nickel transport system ATP-binding protein
MKPDDVRKSILGTEIAYIPKGAMNALNPTRKVIHFIEDVIQAHDEYIRRQERDLDGLAKELLRPGAFGGSAAKIPVELSGGMKQRTVIAISVIFRPKVLIADEPSSALDVTSQKMVIKMLNIDGKWLIKSMIFITHELPLLYNVTDDIMVMYAGQIVEKGRARSRVRSAPSLFQRLDGLDHRARSGLRDVKLTAIPGVPPNLKKPPAGCRFAERCKYVARMQVYSVPLRDIGGAALTAASYRKRERIAREAYKNEKR